MNTDTAAALKAFITSVEDLTQAAVLIVGVDTAKKVIQTAELLKEKISLDDTIE